MKADPTHVYRTSDPATVAAYLATVAEINAFARQVQADARKLGRNMGALLGGGLFAAAEVVGLAPLDPKDPPPGWRLVRKRLEPMRGRAGAAARAWIAARKPPADIPTVLARHGLPRNDSRGGATGLPLVFLHEDTLWAMYEGVPDGGWQPDSCDVCTWEPAKLSEFYAAKEAVLTLVDDTPEPDGGPAQ
jgi:hypothetical protein